MAISQEDRFRSTASAESTQNGKVLSGWKDIANYLQRGVRTVQRYERERALPIRRLSPKLKDSVIAKKTELDSWLSASHFRIRPIPDFKPVCRRSNQLRADFLQIDSQMALTFSGMALRETGMTKRQRTTTIARKAYDTITWLRESIDLTVEETAKLDVNMERLKYELQSLGELF